MQNDFEKEIQRILNGRNKEIEEENNHLLEIAKKEYSRLFQEKTKEDFLELDKKEKELQLHKSKKTKTMKKLIFILFIIIALGFIYFKFIRNNETKSIEYSLTTTISKIIADPRNYEGEKVSVHGTVESSFNLGVKYYVLNDGTGTIYVITERAVPKVGEVVKATGIFNQRLKIGDLQVETITEK